MDPVTSDNNNYSQLNPDGIRSLQERSRLDVNHDLLQDLLSAKLMVRRLVDENLVWPNAC